MRSRTNIEQATEISRKVLEEQVLVLQKEVLRHEEALGKILHATTDEYIRELARKGLGGTK